MPLGAGYTVEEQLTGEAEHGGIQIIACPLKPERYDPPPSREGLMLMEYAEHSVYCASAPPEMVACLFVYLSSKGDSNGLWPDRQVGKSKTIR
jgi:hypothetical protein